MIDTESEPGAWEREMAMRPKTQEAGGRVMDYDELLDDLDHWRGVHPRAAKAIRALLAERDAMLAAAPSPAWIKVSERLPTKNDSDERGYVWTYCNLFWVRLEAWHSITPATHWMPKPRVQPPSPPEGE